MHGLYNRLSANCLNPLVGHQSTATVANLMSRCDFYCLPNDNNSNLPINPYINSVFKYNDSTSNIVVAKGDSAASNNYWRTEDKDILFNRIKIDRPSVTLPDNSCIQSNEEGTIPLSLLLSSQAKKASIMPKLKKLSLISLGQLDNNNCTILLDNDKLIAVKNKEVVLQGIRNKLDGLWDIPIF